MTVRYDLYEIPSLDGEESETPRLHARVVYKGLVTTQDLAEKLEYGTSLTVGDIENVLTSLSFQIVKELSEGSRIHIEGLGYFQMTVTSPIVSSEKEIRGEDVKFKAITFLPEKRIKKKLVNTQFLRTKRKNHSSKYTAEELDKILTEYFENNEYITRMEFQMECSLTKGTAIRKLNELVDEKKLRKEGLRQFPIYKPEKGWYGK